MPDISEEELKRLKGVAYSSGYQRGIKTAKVKQRASRSEAAREAFRNRAFLAALPSCINAQGWIDGKKKSITTLPGRTKLAWYFADEALKEFRP